MELVYFIKLYIIHGFKNKNDLSRYSMQITWHDLGWNIHFLTQMGHNIWDTRRLKNFWSILELFYIPFYSSVMKCDEIYMFYNIYLLKIITKNNTTKTILAMTDHGKWELLLTYWTDFMKNILIPPSILAIDEIINSKEG